MNNHLYRVSDGSSVEYLTEWTIKNRLPHILLAMGWEIESMTFKHKGKTVTINVVDCNDNPLRESKILV